MREHLDRINVGKFLGAAELGSGEVPHAGTGWHQMGGTRMSRRPVFKGVVDAPLPPPSDGEPIHCRELHFSVNGAGYANPTLTVAAVALRLGDHLA